jgi:hypothetical protein
MEEISLSKVNRRVPITEYLHVMFLIEQLNILPKIASLHSPFQIPVMSGSVLSRMQQISDTRLVPLKAITYDPLRMEHRSRHGLVY